MSQPDDHKIGIAGRFRLSEEALSTAEASGLHVSMHAKGGYILSHGLKGPKADLSKLIPTLPSDKETLTLREVNTALGFMHQPIKHSIGGNLDARMKTHRVLRFLTTGVSEIDTAEDDEQAECHAAAIESMKNNDAWRSDREVMVKNDQEESFVTIPGLRIDLEKGLILDVNSSSIRSAPMHNALFKHISRYLPETQNGEIIFDSKTFAQFCQNIEKDKALDRFMADVRQERMSLIANDNTQTKSGHLNALGYNQIFSMPASYPLKNNVAALAGCTSALTPLIKSPEVKESWRSYCPTQAKKTPFDHIAMELDVLTAQLETLSAQSDLSPSQWQATLSEFSSLICFSREAAKVLELNPEHEILLQDEFMRSAVAPQMMENHHREALKILKKAMDKNGSPFGDMMKSFGKSLLTVIDDTVSYVTETRKRALIVGSLTALYVTGQMAATDPDIQKWGSEKIAVASEMIMGPKEEKPKEEEIFFFGEDGLESANLKVDDKYRVDENPQVQNASGQEVDNAVIAETPAMCQVTHYHLRGTQLIPQCFFNDKIKDFSNGVIDYTDGFSDEVSVRSGISAMPESAGSAFSNHARQAVSPTANFWFYLNILQFMAHVPFFFSMGSRGVRQGPRALKEIGLLFGEFADSSVTMMKQRPLAIPMMLGGVAAGLATDLSLAGTVLSGIGGGLAGNYAWHRKSPLQRRLKELTDKEHEQPLNPAGIHDSLNLSLRPDNPNVNLQNTLALELDIAGIKKHFKLGPDEFAALHNALLHYDQLIQTAAHNLALETSWEQRLLAQDAQRALAAMKKYELDGDASKLAPVLNVSLPDIAGSQMRTQNYSSVFKALKKKGDPAQTEALLSRHGAIVHGQRKRADAMEALESRLNEKDLKLQDKFILKARQSLTASWDRDVRGMRGLQSLYTKIPAKKPIATAYALAAMSAISLDMTGNSHILGEQAAKISDAISGYHGQAYGTVLTTGAFGGYNIYDDIILNDVAGGGTFLLFGIAAGYYGRRKFLKPLQTGAKVHFDFKSLDAA